MTDLSTWLLTGLVNHGQVVLGAALFLAALGVPLPATMLVVAAGAFTQQGLLDPVDAAATGISAAVAGDMSSYGVARWGSRWLPAGLLQSGAWSQASGLFQRWGPWGVLVTRFLLTPLALPVNILAGTTGLMWWRFLVPVMAGELLWVIGFGWLGRLFADTWEAWSALGDDLTGLLLAVVSVLVGGVVLWRRLRRA